MQLTRRNNSCNWRTRHVLILFFCVLTAINPLVCLIVSGLRLSFFHENDELACLDNCLPGKNSTVGVLKQIGSRAKLKVCASHSLLRKIWKPRDSVLISINLLPLQETTRVFLVWAYHDVDDASNPRMFSMHTRRNHSMGSFHILYANSNPMISTQGTKTAERESEPSTARPVRVTAKVKSLGIHLGGSFLIISFLTILNFLVKFIQ